MCVQRVWRVSVKVPCFAAVLALVASPALSLSCLPSDAAATYLRAAEAEESYIVVHGQLRFDESKLAEWVGITTEGRVQQGDRSLEIPARLRGKSLSRTGFDARFDREISLKIACWGPWCGGVGSGDTYLAFLQKHDDGYTLVADPCSSWLVFPPHKAQMETLTQCIQVRSCKPGDGVSPQ